MANRVAEVNFTDFVDGDTFTTRSINFFAADGTTPLDLSDATPKVMIRKKDWNGKLVRTCVIGDGLTWVDQSLGQLQFGNISIDWGGADTYYYDVQLTYATSGIVRTYLRGRIEVIKQVTT